MERFAHRFEQVAPRQLPDAEDEVNADPIAWVRQVALRPARVLYPDGRDGKDPKGLNSARPVRQLHTWYGRVLGWPHQDLVPVRLAELPSGRTLEADLEEQLFTAGVAAVAPGAPFTLRCWVEWTGQEWTPVAKVSPA